MHNLFKEDFAFLFTKFLGIVQAKNRPFRIQDHGSCSDRTSQRSPSCLVYACDGHEPGFPGLPFIMAKQLESFQIAGFCHLFFPRFQ